MAGLEVPILAGAALALGIMGRFSPQPPASTVTKTVVEEVLQTVTEYVTATATAASATTSGSVSLASKASSMATPLVTARTTALPAGCPGFLAELVPKAIFWTNVLLWPGFVLFILAVIATKVVGVFVLYTGMRDDWGSCPFHHQDAQHIPSRHPSPRTSRRPSNAGTQATNSSSSGVEQGRDRERSRGRSQRSYEQLRPLGQGFEAGAAANQRIHEVLRRRLRSAEETIAARFPVQEDLTQSAVSRQSPLDRRELINRIADRADVLNRDMSALLDRRERARHVANQVVVPAREVSAFSDSSEEWEDVGVILRNEVGDGDHGVWCRPSG